MRALRTSTTLGWAVLAISAYLTPLAALAGTDTAKRCPEPAASSVTINVKSKGAKGDGRADDTAAIQAAIDAVAKGGAVLVPDGTYLVSTLPRETVRLKSDMILKLSPHAVLKAIPSNEKRVALLRISNASNVIVVGGTLQGQRDKLQEARGLGMGIRIDNGASQDFSPERDRQRHVGRRLLYRRCERCDVMRRHREQQPPPGSVHHPRRQHLGEELAVSDHQRRASRRRHRPRARRARAGHRQYPHSVVAISRQCRTRHSHQRQEGTGLECRNHVGMCFARASRS